MLKRFGVSILLFAALVPATASLRPWYSRWGATAEETHMTLPGDELMHFSAKQSTLAVTVAASPDKIWPWLAQMSAEQRRLQGIQERASGKLPAEWVSESDRAAKINGITT